MAMYLLKPHDRHASASWSARPGRPRARAIRWRASSTASKRASSRSARATATCWPWRSRIAGMFVIGFLASVLLSFVPGAVPGRNFFPSVDSGQITLHVRAAGRHAHRGDRGAVRRHRAGRSARPSRPTSSARSSTTSACRSARINRVYNNTGGIGPQDGDIYISLNEKHQPTADYVQHAARARCRARFPGIDLLVPARRHHQPDPELRRAGADRRAGRRPEPAARPGLRRRAAAQACARIPGIADARLQQSTDYPAAAASTSTAPALAQLGLTERDVTNTRGHLAGRQLPDRAGLLARTRKNGVSYPIVAQTPQYQVDTPVRAGEHPGHRRRAGAACRCWAASAPSPASRRRRGRHATTTIQPVVRPLRHHPGPRPGRASPRTSRR